MGLKPPQQQTAEFYAAVAGVLRSDNVGQWTSDHIQEAKSYSGWNYLAIAALGREAARAHVYAYKDGSDRGQALRKSWKAKHGPMWKSMATQDGAAQMADESSWVAKLALKPSGTQTGELFRWEYMQQMHLHGCCLIFNRPTVDGTRTAARYIVPMALTQPVYPGQDPKCPEGGVRILPYQAGMGWYVNPMISYLSGATISTKMLSIIRYPHPLQRGDGRSPSDAAGWWIDTSMMVDRARWKQLKRGPRPHGIVSVEGDDVDAAKLQLIEDKLNAKLDDKEGYDQRAIALNANVDFEKDFSPHEMDYVGSFEQLGETILATHGTNKALVGLTDNMTYGSLAAALRQAGSVVQSDLDLLSADYTMLVQDEGAAEAIEFEVQPVDDPDLTERQLATDLSAGVRLGKEWRSIRGLPPYGDWRDEARVTANGFIMDPPEPPKQSAGNPQAEQSFSVFRSLAKASPDGKPVGDHVQPVVAVDLDGTLAEYDTFDPDVIGDPIPKIVDRVRALKAAGVSIVIFTCREDNELLRDWLDRYDIPYDAVNENPSGESSSSGKVFAHAYLDDRGVNVEEGVRAIAKLLPEGPAKQRLLKESRNEGPGIVMLELSSGVTEAILAEQDKIDAGELVGDGYEDHPHVTLLYGIVGVEDEEVVADVRRLGQVDVVFGQTSVFANDGEDVVKVDIESPQLLKHREKLLGSLPVLQQQHPNYQPHITLAYVQPGKGEAYAGKNSLTGKSATLTRATIKVDGVSFNVPLRQPS